MPEVDVSRWRASNTVRCELRRGSRPICARALPSVAAGVSGITQYSGYKDAKVERFRYAVSQPSRIVVKGV